MMVRVCFRAVWIVRLATMIPKQVVIAKCAAMVFAVVLIVWRAITCQRPIATMDHANMSNVRMIWPAIMLLMRRAKTTHFASTLVAWMKVRATMTLGHGCENSSCFYPSCSDPEACNYDSEYLCEDNSECQYPSISGVLFNDANQNGFLDNLFFNEPGLSGWQITIPELNLQVYTNSDGEFEFNDLPIGDYVVLVEVIEEGWSATTPLSVEVFDCGGNVNFGFAADGSPPFWVAGPCCIWMMDIHW